MMPRILISTLGAKSHILPFLPVVREMMRRGHDVLWLCDEECRELIASSAARFLPTRRCPKSGTIVEALDGITGLPRAKAFANEMLVRPIKGLLADFREAIADFPADLVLADSFCFAARFLHELGGPPWAILNITVCTYWTPDVGPHGPAFPPAASAIGRMKNRAILGRVVKVGHTEAYDELDSLRSSLGLPPLERGSLFNHLFSPFLQLQPCTQAFEYPRRPFPDSLRFIGPLLPSVTGNFTPPEWWGDLDSGKPVILLTQGTVSNARSELIAAAAEAFANEDVLVLLTTGGSRSCLPPSLPGNFRVADFIPYQTLLPRVSVFVTNGGYGAVNQALAQGIPIIAAGDSEEKPEICARVAWSGAGIDLRSGSPSAKALRVALQKILSDPRYRNRAREIQADYAAHDAPKEAVDHIERVATAAR
jgi:MGT family glycosyltransferase